MPTSNPAAASPACSWRFYCVWGAGRSLVWALEYVWQVGSAGKGGGAHAVDVGNPSGGAPGLFTVSYVDVALGRLPVATMQQLLGWLALHPHSGSVFQRLSQELEAAAAEQHPAVWNMMVGRGGGGGGGVRGRGWHVIMLAWCSLETQGVCRLHLGWYHTTCLPWVSWEGMRAVVKVVRLQFTSSVKWTALQLGPLCVDVHKHKDSGPVLAVVAALAEDAGATGVSPVRCGRLGGGGAAAGGGIWQPAAQQQRPHPPGPPLFTWACSGARGGRIQRRRNTAGRRRRGAASAVPHPTPAAAAAACRE